MYVWFDALINYISALGWPENLEQFTQYWPGVQLAGKDNLRQQAAMWQAMLMSAGLPNSKRVLINGFINVEGQKMSKSLGNVIAPQDMVAKYGLDSTRFLLISLGTFSQDMDVSWDKFGERYTADLANGLGNLCSRVAKMADNEHLNLTAPEVRINQKYQTMMDHYQLISALDWIIDFVKQTDQYLSETKPWKLSGQEKKEIITAAVERIQQIAFHLLPFMPSTAEKIQTHFTGKVQALDPLFPRSS
jgi:methionyl-tRNA synthetase